MKPAPDFVPCRQLADLDATLGREVDAAWARKEAAYWTRKAD